jgi:membrane-bound lytic murein transglycosylase B
MSGLAAAQPDSVLIEQFIVRHANKFQIPESQVRAVLKQAVFQPTIIERMNKPAEKMPWHKYRPIFMKDERINAGVAFWKEHESTIAKVSREYAVAPEIIVAIIGVESYFGRSKGTHKVLDALFTLAFGYPKRSTFFTSELDAFLAMCREENMDPMTIKGSYAGAMGYCQFMPSSYRAYAKSFDVGTNRDLINSPEDAIASVANYFKQHKWTDGGIVAIPIKTSEFAKAVPENPSKPSKSLGYYEQYGYQPAIDIDPNVKVTLVELESVDGKEYWFGFHNFYVITRYNHSPLYAMAVYQLSEEIKARRKVN